MAEELQILSEKKRGAILILQEHNFFEIMNYFFEKCQGTYFSVRIAGINGGGHNVHLGGGKFIGFIKQNTLVERFLINDSNSDTEGYFAIRTAEDLSCILYLNNPVSKIDLSVSNMNYGDFYDGCRGNFSLKINDQPVYEGNCTTKSNDDGRGRIFVLDFDHAVKMIVLRKDWVEGLLPIMNRIFLTANSDNETNETKKTFEDQQNQMQGKFSLGDFNNTES